MHLRSRENRLEGAGRCCALSAFLLFAFGPVIAQQLAPAQPPQQRTSLPAEGSAQTGVTTAQPSLSVARDPAPSPDADPPPVPMGNQQAGPLGTIARGTGGKFTLRENAY